MPVYLGMDWSERKHDVVFLNEAGALLARLTFPHTPEGLLQLDRTRQGLGLDPGECLIGLETAHHLLVDVLWDYGYSRVYVIPPGVVKSSRGRYGQSGARSDQSDARLLADLVRTDRVRFAPWQPDRLLTRQMRARVSLLLHLTQSAIRLSNRLRAVLLRYYPALLQAFRNLDAQIALEFVRAFPTPQAAARLSLAQFQTFARQHHYPHPRRLPACFARLQQPALAAHPDTVQVYQDEAPLLASLLLHLVRQKYTIGQELLALFRQHPDQALFASLPGAGEFLAPALLVKFGDDRERFPTPGSVQALAGTCPVTAASGQRRVVKFRRGCDREFRHIAQQWAIHSLPQSAWANAYLEQVRPHCRSQSHAHRCLANRWLAVAWKVWQTRQRYDEAYHAGQRLARSQPRA